MSIATAIQNAQQRVANAYDAIEAKGGTMPATQNLSNMPTAIASIPSGGTDNLPTFISNGISSFTDNTITKIRPYAFYYDNTTNSTNPITSISCQNVTEIGTYAFYSCDGLTNFSFPSLQIIRSDAFDNCNGLTSISIPSTVTILEGSCFNSCSNVITLTIPPSVTNIARTAFGNLSNAEEVNYNATNAEYDTSSNTNYVFRNLGKSKNNLIFNIGNNVKNIPAYFLRSSSSSSQLPNIKTLNIPNDNSIESIGRDAFYKCSGLSSLTLPRMTVINKSQAMRGSFQQCTNLTSLSFPALTSSSFGSYTDQFYLMLSGVTGCTVHFPSNLQSVIGGWSDVTAGFGGTDTTILFDLTATS